MCPCNVRFLRHILTVNDFCEKKITHHFVKTQARRLSYTIITTARAECRAASEHPYSQANFLMGRIPSRK